MRRVVLSVVLVAVMFPLLMAQQQPAPPQRVIINFLLPIDSNSVNMLLAVVNGQVRSGVKKITIVISSPGGDTASAFAAYNILRNVPAEITTFNAGNVDSAAMLLYCAGKHRYSFPDPARFLIHSNALTLGPGVPLDYTFLDAELSQIKSLNQMVSDVVVANSKKTKAEVDAAIHGQTILTPKEAQQWGIVQEIRDTFMEDGAVFVSVNTDAPAEKPAPSNAPTITAGHSTQ
jgi:ATP-dependent Clp protease protease subunit